MQKITPFLYIIAAIALGLVAVASIIDLLRALFVPNTLTAVESAIGTGVLALMLAVMATTLFQAGWRRLKNKQDEQN